MLGKKSLYTFLICLATSGALADITDNNNGMVGPAQFALEYSSQFNFIANTHWTNYLTPNNTFGFEVDFGGYEFRLGGTLAHAFNDQNRIKITGEHLADSLNFNYTNSDETQWIGQNEVGAAYENVAPESWVKNFEVGGYYTHAESGSFDNKFFSNPTGSFTDIRRYDGANSYAIYAGMVFSPWYRSRVGAALYYDHVDYSPIFVEAKDSSGIGAAVSLEQLLTDRWKIGLLATPRQPFQRYLAGISWLAPTRPGTRLEIALNASHLTGDIPTSTDNRVMLGFAYSWGGDPCGLRADYTNDNPDSLIAWTARPVGHMPAVLVQPDEAVIP